MYRLKKDKDRVKHIKEYTFKKWTELYWEFIGNYLLISLSSLGHTPPGSWMPLSPGQALLLSPGKPHSPGR